MLSEEGLSVKKQLEELNQSKRRVRNLQEELKGLTEAADMLKSSSLGMPGGSGGEKISVPMKYVLRLELLEQKLMNAIDKAIELEDKFLESITKLDVLSQNLLMERYFTGKSLRRIIREFNYSESHIYRIYNNAYEKLGNNQNKR